METQRNVNKFKILFQKVVEPNYVMNNYYADGIINKMTTNRDAEIKEIFNTPVMCNSLCQALDHLDNVHPTVQVFLIRILGAYSWHELFFMKLFTRHGDKIQKGFQEINSPNMKPSHKVALLEVALTIVKHNSGISWLLETGVWKEILSLCNQKQTVFVIRPTYKFMAELLWRLNDLLDTNNLRLVLNELLKPFERNILLQESMTPEEEEEIVRTVEPVLHVLMVVVTDPKILKYSPLIEMLLRDFTIASHLYITSDRTRQEDFVLLLAKLIVWFQFSKLFLIKPIEPGVQYVKTDILDLSVCYFNFLQMFIQRRSPTLVLDFCIAYNTIFCKISKDKEFIWHPEVKNLLWNQTLFMCLVPLVMFVMRKNENMKDPKLEEFTTRLMNSSCEHTAKGLYALRSLLEETDLIQCVVQCVKKLSAIKNSLNNDQANFIFQTLFYVLRDYDHFDDYGNLKPTEVIPYENEDTKILVMTYIMDMVLCLLKNYKINWSGSIEVICLYSVVFTILQKPNLSTKFVVSCLNVITISIKLFLPPNLALLLETQPGTSMDLLGTLIYRKMHDLSWEIRDSALELLQICTEISFVKFPSFQKQILDNDLINVAAALAFNDYESYVQASALKCLGAASKVSPIWEQLKSKYPEIQCHITAVLRNNQEGIVRKEACSVICDLYQNLKLSPEYKQRLYDHMLSTALCDFHWEVQIYALKFWKMVFQSLLNDQGMLDGTFPPVTFSKESRKIVSLNLEEIQKRIIKILEELSSVGLFTILIKLLQDDSEIEVVDQTLLLSCNIIDVLNKYKVIECLKPRPGADECEDGLIFEIKEDEDYQMIEDLPIEMPSSDNVIDGIINADDLNLLANIYESHMTLQNAKTKELLRPLQPRLKLIKYASPYMFVKFLNSRDFRQMIDERRKWNEGIRSLSSLLDDVLGIYDIDSEVNALDCY